MSGESAEFLSCGLSIEPQRTRRAQFRRLEFEVRSSKFDVGVGSSEPYKA
jgi:hypothetical protein